MNWNTYFYVCVLLFLFFVLVIFVFFLVNQQMLRLINV